VKNQGVIARPLPDPVIARLREVTNQVLVEANKDPVTKKVYDSFMAFKAKYDSWAGYSEAVYHNKIRG
jgi:TRAP-type mannitol/chloroaromatic compound transport system substrate-binding protein